MKLLRQVSRKYGDTKYHKHWVIIPNDLIEKLGWDEGDELEADVKNDKLVMTKKK
jgi:antitoxin component of MazEF toxin-antitoxin module